MKIKLFGMSFRLEILIAFFLIGWFFQANTLCSCSKVSLNEAFTLLKTLGDSPLDYRMGDGVEGSWDTKKQHIINTSDTVTNGTSVPLNGTLFFFKDNKGGTNCNGNYSTSTGCIGLTSEQGNYLNTRGGNRITGQY